ncbi:phage tail tape measure protein [Glutamicibacter sp. X7]
MAVQKLMFDIIGNADKVDKTFDEIVQSAETMGGRLKSAGKNMFAGMMDPKLGMAAGGLAGAALTKGLFQALDADSINREISAGLGLDPAQAETVGAATGDLYADAFGESLADVGSAVETVISTFPAMKAAGEDAIEDLTGQAMSLAKTLDSDVQDAAKAAGVMVETGLAKDGTEAMDLLAAASQKVPKAMRSELIPILSEYSKDFEALGIQGPNALGLIADAAAGGEIQIDKTGDALKEFMIRAGNLGDKGAQDALKAMGLSGQEMANDLLAGGDRSAKAFKQITDGLKGIKDPSKQAEAAVALFGTPLEDIGMNKIPGFLDALTSADGGLGKTAGKAKELSDALGEGPEAAMTSLGREAESVLGGMVAGALPVLTPLLEGLRQFAPILGPLVVALGAFAVAQGIANAVMWASPVTWIVAGIVLLLGALALLIANWDSVVAWVTEIWGGFMAWLTEATAGFVAGWNAMWGAVGAFLAGLWQQFVDGATQMGSDLVAFFTGLPDMILGALKGAGSWLVETGKNIIQGLLDGISSLAGTIGNFFLDLLPDWIVGPFKAALGIHSPSKVFAGFGENIGEGVLVGVEDMAPAIDDTMAHLVEVPDGPGPASFAQATAPASTGTQVVEKNTTYAPVYQVDGADAEELFQKLWRQFREKAREEGADVGE